MASSAVRLVGSGVWAAGGRAQAGRDINVSKAAVTRCESTVWDPITGWGGASAVGRPNECCNFDDRRAIASR